MKRKTLEEFIEQVKQVHGDRYLLNKITEYKNNRTQIIVTCRVHGDFVTRPDYLVAGNGCPKCAGNMPLTQEEALNKAKKVHGDKYDYSKFVYKGTEKKACIICPEHGEFWQTPHMHFSGQGCPKCYGNERKTNECIIADFRKVHGDKYDYTKVDYVNAFTKVCIVCPEHGEFWQTPHSHLYGHGCPSCAKKRRYDRDYFIEKAKKVHGDKYDYSLISDIKNNRTKVPIICKKHGVFYQAIENHIGQKQGCPKCINSQLELNFENFLKEKEIKYNSKHKFEWLGSQHLDFYLPEYNIGVECQGAQHFIPSNFGTSKRSPEECFQMVLRRDKEKLEKCQANGVKLLYFSQPMNIHFPYQVFTDYNEILLEIKQNK